VVPPPLVVEVAAAPLWLVIGTPIITPPADPLPLVPGPMPLESGVLLS
jgi:hypothetical protein